MNKTFNSIKTVAIVAIAFAAISITASFSMVANATTCKIPMDDITIMVGQTKTEDISVYTAECQYAIAPYKAEAIDPNDRFVTIAHPNSYSLVWDGSSVEITGNEVGESVIKFYYSSNYNGVNTEYAYELNRITIRVTAAPPTCAITSTTIPDQTVLIGTLGTQGTLDVSSHFTATNCDTPITYTSAPTTKVTVAGLGADDGTLTMDAVEGVTAGTTEDITITATSGDVTDTQVFTVTVEKAPAPECFTNPSVISTIEVKAGETVEIDISDFIEISDTCTAITYGPSTITEYDFAFDTYSIEWDGSSIAITGKQIGSESISFSVEGLNEDGVSEVYNEWPSVDVEVKNPNPCTLTPTGTPNEIVISLEEGEKLLTTDYYTLSGQTDSGGECDVTVETTQIEQLDENGVELISNGFVFYTPLIPITNGDGIVSFTGVTEGGTDTFQVLITAGEYPNEVELPIEVSVTVPHTCAITSTPIPPQTVVIGTQGTLDVSSYFVVTNCDTPVVTYASTQADEDEVTVAGLGVNDATLTMDGSTAGTEDITVTATSGDVTVEEVFTVTVEEAPCTITSTTIPGQNVVIGTQGTLDVSSYFTATNCDTPVTYASTQADKDEVTVAGLGRDDATLTMDGSTAGTEDITVTATSGDVTATQVFTVTVEEAPTCAIASTPIPGQTVTIDTRKTLDVSSYFTVTNCDTPVTYTRNQQSGTSEVTINGIGKNDGTFTIRGGESEGETSITITVTSGDVTAEEVFTVTVTATAPTCAITSTTIPGQPVVIGTPGTLDVSSYFTATNCDTPVTYGHTQTDTTEVTVAGLGVNDATLTMDGSTAGTEDITVTATSGDVTATQVFTVTVTAPTPIVDPTPVVDPTPETVVTPRRSSGGGGGGGGSRSARQQVQSTPVVVETATQQLTVAEIEVLIKEIKEKIVQLQVIIALRLQIIEVQKKIEAHLAQA